VNGATRVRRERGDARTRGPEVGEMGTAQERSRRGRGENWRRRRLRRLGNALPFCFLAGTGGGGGGDGRGGG
jgi:hypothetical protein